MSFNSELGNFQAKREQELCKNAPTKEQKDPKDHNKTSKHAILIMSYEEKAATGEGIPLKTVQAGPRRRKNTFGPGNDGEGGDYYKRLQDKRTNELDKSAKYQQQYRKDPIGEKFKSWFS
ncbi:10535_t:CDS:1 [Ambispora leptoticha]|uniref:10535_t:CDS:1 n=1 Tax=Ambispora leptoticha TaxID=144679 RepID=A0A9N9HUN0_9GLOM|nr:10535_t:CDS:1 [Ambispora leptoticha]